MYFHYPLNMLCRGIYTTEQILLLSWYCSRKTLFLVEQNLSKKTTLKMSWLDASAHVHFDTIHRHFQVFSSVHYCHCWGQDKWSLMVTITSPVLEKQTCQKMFSCWNVYSWSTDTEIVTLTALFFFWRINGECVDDSGGVALSSAPFSFHEQGGNALEGAFQKQ